MTRKALIRKLSLSDADLDDIAAAVARAEEGTTGEIVLAITAESSDYAFWELFAACVSSFLLMVCMIPLASRIDTLLRGLFWGGQAWRLVAFYLGTGALLVSVLYLLYNIPCIDRLVIPVQFRRRAVSHRAMRYFVESGVHCTSAHCGILVFVSYFEREVRIIADRGISETITEDLWNLIADEMIEQLAQGKAKDAFLCAVARCSQLLAERYPVHGDTANELQDGLVVVED